MQASPRGCDQVLGWRNHEKRWVRVGRWTWASPALISSSSCVRTGRRPRASAISTWAATNMRTGKGLVGDSGTGGSRWRGGVCSNASSGRDAAQVWRQHPRANPWGERGRRGSSCCCCIQNRCPGGTLQGHCPCWASSLRRSAEETHWASRSGSWEHCAKWAWWEGASCGQGRLTLGP